MRNIHKQWSKILVLFFLACMLLGGSFAYAAPMLWSYPDDHLLISEVNYTGSPGTGAGTEWIELYNPTANDINYETIRIYSSNGTTIDLLTPTPGPYTTPYPPINSRCFLYLAYDAAAFYTVYNQCPNHAQIVDPVNCPEAKKYLLVLWRNIKCR